MKEFFAPGEDDIRLFIQDDEEQHDEHEQHAPDEQPPPCIEGNEGDGVARRKDGDHARDKDDGKKVQKGHGRDSRHKAEHVVGKHGKQKHGTQKEFILPLEFFQPFFQRLLPHDPRNDAEARIPPDQKGDHGTEQYPDEAVNAPEQAAEQHAPRNNGDGARDGQNDDLQKLQRDKERSHPPACTAEIFLEFFLVAQNGKEARLEQRIEKRRRKDEQNIQDDAAAVDELLAHKVSDVIRRQHGGIEQRPADEREDIHAV